MELEQALKILKKLSKDINELLNFVGVESTVFKIKKTEAKSINTVLQALEDLQKENEGIKARIDKYIQGGNETLRLEHEETLKYYHENYIEKDKIKEKVKEQTKIIDKLLEDMIDKNTGCINVSYLSKKEKEEVINKRNCLLVQKATLQQFEKDILKDSNTKVEECWLCKEIETNTYKNESSNKKTRLVFYKETGGTYIIRAWGEDVCEQEITHCPLCGRKLGV